MTPERTSTANPRDVATWIIDRLMTAGFTAYLAGGCVRDRLLGIEPKDFDVATDAHPDRIRDVFPGARSVGEAFGVMLVRRDGRTVEVATFRADGPYRDGRRPASVTFSTPEDDARRRDFTINGLFEDTTTQQVIDYVGGRDDLAAGVIRAIGDPDARIEEDRLRMLRAVRFAARFGFDIEVATAAAVRRHAGELAGVSRERIGQELRLMMADPNRSTAIHLIHQLGLASSVLDVDASRAELDLPHLDDLDSAAPFAVGMAAWELDRRASGDGPTRSTDEAVEALGSALILANLESRQIRDLLDDVEAIRERWGSLGVAGRKRLAARASFDWAVRVMHPLDPERAAEVRAEVARLAETGLAPTPLIAGDDLIAMGFEPGPAFRTVLEAVYDALLEGRIGDRQEAEQLARRLYKAAKGTF